MQTQLQGQEVLILYADVLAFLNFALDFLCLCICAKVAGRRFIGWRAVLGALAGALYALASVPLSVLSGAVQLLLHLLAACLICLIAFPVRGMLPKLFGKTVFVFLLTEAGLGGIITAAYYIGQRKATAVGIIVLALLFGGALALYGLYCRKKVYARNMKIEVTFGETRVQADVLVDSGNLVTEPFSALPVVILSASVLPAPLNKPDLENSPVPLRAIPIRTGTGMGLLYGFIPDSITLCPPFEKQRRVDAVIGIDTDNTDFAGCDGLLPGALL